VSAPARIVCIAVACLFAVNAGLKAADTLRVITHDGVTVVTDPSTGAKSYPAWGVFPGAGFSTRKATMRVTFGCPDSMRCADWDYLDRIVARRKGTAPADTLNFEIGRMLTPYGGAFGRDWKFGWTVDVTDFALVLRDSVEIDYVHTGYEPNNDRGWKITVTFEFIAGPPAASPLRIDKIYDGSYAYGDSARPISASLAPVTFTAAAGAGYARLLVFQTGHGGDDSGCGEFCKKYREIVFDGKVADRRPVWKECGDNPLSPQAGTWIYDRANWCPGDLLPPEAFDFPVTPGSTHTVDIEMEPYTLPGTAANEAITAYIVQYAPPAAQRDLELLAVDVPSAGDPDRRSNPACASARVAVRNNGSAPVTGFYVRYGTFGFDDRMFVWEGTLASNAVTVLDLPGEIPMRSAGNKFGAEVHLRGDADDAWPADNALMVPFDPAPAHKSPVILELRTNAEPSQTSYVLRRSDGTAVREVKPGSLPPDSVIADTFRLETGCYTLEIADSAGDGLEFWYNVKGGRGTARLFDLSGSMLKSFESDFGSFIRYDFRVSEDRRIWAPPSPEPSIGLFPTRTLGVTTMDYLANAPKRVIVQIVADPGGEVVEEHEYPDLRSGRFSYDLTARGPQRYYLKVFSEGVLKFNKRIRVVEKIE
jgi:hypothetical protein